MAISCEPLLKPPARPPKLNTLNMYAIVCRGACGKLGEHHGELMSLMYDLEAFGFGAFHTRRDRLRGLSIDRGQGRLGFVN